MWIIDFGVAMPIHEAALYERPFEHVKQHVKPFRDSVRRESYRRKWWLHVEPGAGMRAALAGLDRYIGTPTTTKHRLFVWLDSRTLADHSLIAFASRDDLMFGILHSRVHELWARRMGTQLREYESGFRYTPTSTFETFPLPSPTSDQATAISLAAKELNRLREGWLNPPNMEPDQLEQRTLTNLYNERPAWLGNAHATLDAAVLAAYRWSEEIADDDLLARLLGLNVERSQKSSQATEPAAAGSLRD